MLTTLAVHAPRPHEGDLVDLLDDCHRRLRRFLGIAAHLADTGAVTDAEAGEAAGAVDRYLSVALPLHVRDEEDSVLPRLRGRSVVVDHALRSMTQQHHEQEAALVQLRALCREIAQTPAHRLALRQPLAAACATLEAAFGSHLAIEEQVIFPAIRRLLDGDQQAEILHELRARRTPRM
jgi:iron-sulfur cluster repair protein YtfE (RIC family)